MKHQTIVEYPQLGVAIVPGQGPVHATDVANVYEIHVAGDLVGLFDGMQRAIESAEGGHPSTEDLLCMLLVRGIQTCVNVMGARALGNVISSTHGDMPTHPDDKDLLAASMCAREAGEAARALKLDRSARSSLEQLAAAIESDPLEAARMIRLAASLADDQPPRPDN